MESLFAIVDIFFVSKLGSDAVATVGLTESMLSILYALAMGLAAGVTAIVARRTGEKDPRAASEAAGQAITLALVPTVLLGIVGAMLAPLFLGMMGATPSVVAVGARYTAVMIGGSATIFLLFVINAIFRSAGDAAVAMRTLWIANGLNIVLAPVLVFGLGPFPRMGVVGAAVATTMSRGLGVLYQVYLLRSQKSRRNLHVRASDLRPRFALVKELLRLSSTATLQVLIETASWLSLVRILSAYGSAVLAGYTIAMRVAIFAILPSWGLANAAATLVGQNLGAGEPQRAKTSVRTIARYNVAFLGSIGLLFVFGAHVIVGLFTPDARVADYGADCLRIVALGFVMFAFGMVMIQAFNGAGDTLTPMLINLGCFWLLKLPMAYVLASVFRLGPHGVFVAITIAYSAQALISWALFRRGRWQTQSSV